MISHEYRTPLQAVLLSAEILQKHYDRLTPEQRDMQYRRIARAVEDMATMLDNVILYNRLSRASERVNFETVKVKPYFEGVIRDFELYYHDKAKIVSKTKFKVQEAKVEQRLLQLILSNLISNAIKYSRSEPVVEIEVEVGKDSIKLVIADNGIGIPEEELPLVFEPFYRGKNTKLIAGTGLGLSIVKNSVDLLGGQINVESKLNEGTKFTIEIPIP
jgi:signal transduction histidine kinase